MSAGRGHRNRTVLLHVASVRGCLPACLEYRNAFVRALEMGDFQRIGGGFVQQAPSVDAQLRAAKQRVLELYAQLEQRTRQLSAMHAQLTAETSARLTCSSQNEQLGRRLTALTGERERMAIQMAQLQERAQTAEETAGQLRTVLAEQEQEMEQLHAQALSSQQHKDLATLQEQLPQLRAAAAELPALRAAVAELPALRAAAAEQSFAARAECEALRREVGAAEARGAAAAEAARRVCREAEAMVGEREAAGQQGQSAPPLAAPQLGSCASSGRARRLWAARHSQGKAGSPSPELSHCLGCVSEPPPKPPSS